MTTNKLHCIQTNYSCLVLPSFHTQPSPHVRRSTPAQAPPAFFREAWVMFLGLQPSTVLGLWGSTSPERWSMGWRWEESQQEQWFILAEWMELIPRAVEPLGRFSEGRVSGNWIALNFCLATRIGVHTKCFNIMAVVKVAPQRAGFPSCLGDNFAQLYPSLVSLC